MQYSDIKQVREFCESLHSQPDWKEVIASIDNHEDDFEVDGVRFINDDSIDEIQQDELSSDLYVLGACSDWFLADILDVSIEFVQTLQSSYNFEALGMLIIEKNKLRELQQEYARLDGYGHHFNLYDCSEEELVVKGTLYHVFDNH